MYLCSKDFCTVLVALFDKTGVHGKKLLQNTAFCIQQAYLHQLRSLCCVRGLEVSLLFDVTVTSTLKNLDKTPYYPELDSKSYVKRSASNFSQQLDQTFSFKASNNERKLHKCSKEAVDKVRQNVDYFNNSVLL